MLKILKTYISAHPNLSVCFEAQGAPFTKAADREGVLLVCLRKADTNIEIQEKRERNTDRQEHL